MLPRILYYALTASKYERAPPRELASLVDRRLRRIVRHAYENTKFWHTWLDRVGVRPDDITGVRDLHKIPICTKADLSGVPAEDWVAGDMTKHFRMQTSGTTGGPLPCFYSRAYNDYWNYIHEFRCRSLMGYGFRDKFLIINFAAPKTPSLLPQPAVPDRIPRPDRKTTLGLSYYVLAPIVKRYLQKVFFHYKIEEVLPQIMEYDPDLIMGNINYLRMLAQGVVKHDGQGLHLKKLISRSEVQDESTRKYLEDTFGCPVYNRYGINEFGSVASECEKRSGLHVHADAFLMEAVRDDQAVAYGEKGELVCTALLNGAMPLLRYKIGDVGVMSQEDCECGRTLPLLTSVEGKSVDHVRLPDGRILSPKEVLTVLNSFRPSFRYQFVQEDIASFVLRVFDLESERRDATIDSMVQGLGNLFGINDGITVSHETTKELKAKFRPVVSKVSNRTSDQRWVSPY